MDFQKLMPFLFALTLFIETDDATTEDAPKRCCNNFAILIVVLSIADFGRQSSARLVISPKSFPIKREFDIRINIIYWLIGI